MPEKIRTMVHSSTKILSINLNELKRSRSDNINNPDKININK